MYMYYIVLVNVIYKVNTVCFRVGNFVFQHELDAHTVLMFRVIKAD